MAAFRPAPVRRAFRTLTPFALVGALAGLTPSCRDEAPSDSGVATDDLTARATNPVLGVDNPDPNVLRVVENGKAVYYLSATSDSGDFPIYRSTNLVKWQKLPGGAFRRSGPPGGSLEINGKHFCHLWAPHLARVGPGAFQLSFTATAYATPQAECPPYGEDGGVFLASSSSPAGPYALAERPWEPLTAGGHVTACPASVEASIPHSTDLASNDCQGGSCQGIIRLDSDVFRDPATGRWWMGYAWYTNTPPQVAWEESNYGEHVSLVELDASDPFAVPCTPSVPVVFAGNPHDDATTERLRDYCDRCDEQLSFTRGRFDEEFVRDGHSWGVVEGPSLIRRNGYVYLFMSGSVWDSAFYHVFWAAAPTVEELAFDNPSRLVGRYLIPSEGQSFGHGSAVLGPDGKNFYFVHHRLRHAACRDAGDCARDVWVSPLEFEDRGDGLGDVWVKPRFPAEDPSVRVRLN